MRNIREEFLFLELKKKKSSVLDIQFELFPQSVGNVRLEAKNEAHTIVINMPNQHIDE